jgi:hypothetical protein
MSDHAVRLRDDATGWARVSDDIELTEDAPVLDGLTEQEANDLVQTQWALVHADEPSSGDTGGHGADVAEPPIDLSALTLDELEADLEENDYSATELDALEAAEAAGDGRNGAQDLIDAAREA